jgi:metal-responsive CopG/Arc/MetJ family transcriptional regulator
MYTQISVSLKKDEIKEIDEFAKAQSLSRSQFLRVIIGSKLEQMRERYPSYSSFRLETDLLQSLNFSDSLDYEIIEKKSELVKLEHQKELLKKEGLING